ncbi:TPA: DNA circularization N-terminal domain-containing protein [Yersinia enterocolitica]|uniref:DNA circularization protein n=1 Tax=Yersinia enterocolitica TaxID=630 RepID=UPI0005DC646F|nr:DNA circularization N-terminal domain-containing protein [Yersinia enterocolitica]EKN3386805.1 DNA circularization N-terminal domain-containing protein [Yersinia enterocolitica]EKN3766504.1 DNA circularization N-terminal domain-containing protein [Yersinia enterocolitica]EKN4083095.1 DNA circularization N-terminal domain-containing protein [Yersinia enterocolitica]EKN6167132.1 multidrug DMT transporter permease [Yersinia enterocolitica]EKN6397022.1 multidrug DMT transporter permease [Yersin
MSWSDSILDASFRGVRFDVVNARDSWSRDIAQHEYPYIDGADVQDMGRKARNLRLSALFWGDDYDSRLQSFIAELDKRGAGELIHPIYGSMPNMQVIECQVGHDAENVDYCTVELVFLESKTGNPFFSQDYPTAQADVIFNQVQSLMDAEQSLMDNALAPLRDAKKLMSKSKALASAALNMLLIFRGEITGFVGSTTDFVQYPGAFMSDLQSAVSLTSQNATSSGSSVSAASAISQTNATMSDWGESHRQLTEIANLPTALVSGEKTAPVDIPAGVSVADVAELIAMVTIVVAGELAQDAADIFSNEDINSLLSPTEIERIANDTRQFIQTAIDQHRAQYADATQEVSSSPTALGIAWQPVVEGLKDIALAVQQLAANMITTRPPLIQRQVDSVSNLHLVAHRWYGDYRRAVELQRLNPQLRNPNNLQPGDVLYAYAI